jgi:uncharacterized cupin superfamily protein
MPKTAIPELQTEVPKPHPVLEYLLGAYDYSIIGEAGGLTQFGVHIEVLRPGSKSSLRHWHETEDEMIYMLSGEVVLIEETETRLCKGDAACWPAGAATAHCLENRREADASYLTSGTRNRLDTIHYPDHILITHKDGAARRYSQSDGSPYPERTSK